MTLQLPDLPRPLVELAVGHFPDLDEDRLRAIGRSWLTRGLLLPPLAVQLAALGKKAGQSLDSAAGREFDERVDDQVQNMESQAAYCNAMAEQCFRTADSGEFTKLLIIGSLYVFAAQLLADAMLFAAGAVKAAADRAAAAAAVQTAAR
ncbi:MAG: hypothetical protein HOQ24_12395, partial [Mycobacteriaceae bacterium]|nr:hypothetical protein [Mycobacteriaceae bacterium]